jgi:hypothetical protein
VEVAPAAYVVCTQERTIPAWLQRRMAVHADRVIDLPASHSPFLSMPKRLAGVLAEANPTSGTGRAGRSGDATSSTRPHPPSPTTSHAIMKVTMSRLGCFRMS